MNYVIGDIHSNAVELSALMRRLHLCPEDRLIFVGDYLDKGNDPNETLGILNGLNDMYECDFLIGNHEYVWNQYLLHGDVSRNEFLLKFGGVETIKPFFPDSPEQKLENNQVEEMREALDQYMQLISRCKPFIQRDAFLVVHAGLLPEQLYQDPLHIQERNFFLRPEQMDMRRRYLDRYIVVAGHTHLGENPTFTEGYVNIDLGAGYGKRLGAFCLEERNVVRSDGVVFTYQQTI